MSKRNRPKVDYAALAEQLENERKQRRLEEAQREKTEENATTKALLEDLESDESADEASEYSGLNGEDDDDSASEQQEEEGDYDNYVSAVDKDAVQKGQNNSRDSVMKFEGNVTFEQSTDDIADIRIKWTGRWGNLGSNEGIADPKKVFTFTGPCLREEEHLLVPANGQYEGFYNSSEDSKVEMKYELAFLQKETSQDLWCGGCGNFDDMHYVLAGKYSAETKLLIAYMKVLGHGDNKITLSAEEIASKAKESESFDGIIGKLS